MLRHTLTLILFYAALVTSQDKPCIDDPDVDCASFKDDCTNPKLLPLLTQSCPVTCNLCPSTVSPTTLAPCFDDKSVNCNVFKKNCNDPDYIPMLKKFCPETCNMCPGATTPTPDSNCKDCSPNCASWAKRGFCTNCCYSCQDRERYCAKTCGFCSAGTCKECNSFEKLLSFNKEFSMIL
ncbi:ShKT domain-containing protein [Caenorhabditis elegans]|uniref:ShKT domain-containing protein n=1 Tax=Caenorhabditis elegans TaxID=6239 RepID=Q9U2J2_CAEEL|nr:ShKT domain-containing protein [Caenorhabditis elegans]CAB60339.1 ShKT domain-containing protein [Caenorhabditis elegans]|eukprot:NP_496930.1 Uncharacterized protein CELE_Y39G8B.7 [Caenorhabditis elegans]